MTEQPEVKTERSQRADTLRVVGLALGAGAGLVILLACDLKPGHPAVTATAAVAVLMAVWWITEALPLAITSLVPMVLLPLLGVMNGKVVARQYFNHVIFLFIGGFMVALAMERWNLHKRIALRILLFFGDKPRLILLGFMAATAFLSMWISNTAATMMMVTIVLALVHRLEGGGASPGSRRFAIALLLGVAYSASVGGIATLVGTPPNPIFMRIFEIQFPDGPDITFAAWFSFAFPISVTLLVTIWLFLSLLYGPKKGAMAIDRTVMRRQYEALGPLSFAEWVVLIDFVLLVVLWLTRAGIEVGGFTIPGWGGLFAHPEYLNDGTVAIGMALLLYLVPARPGASTRIMDWPTTARLPWNIVLLFGGGFALAAAFAGSGLSDWLGEELEALQSLHPLILIAVVCLAISFLTELTSNTATTGMILPVMAGLAKAIEVNPLFLMVPVTISCSCAFMMPVATPPNAIVFGSGRIRVLDMARAGVILNVIGMIIIVAAMYVLGGAVWDIDLTTMPDWAGGK
jgi:sodium-dependent dicarboxylate transporter 2/3/5